MRNEKEIIDSDSEENPEGPFREYANNTFFDPSVWDLTIVFGQLGNRLPTETKPEMIWHTSITMPWAQAKVAAYFLLANIVIHEKEHGSISVSSSVAPPEPNITDDGAVEGTDRLQARLADIHREIFGKSNTELNK